MKRILVIMISTVLMSSCVKKLPEMKTTLVGQVVDKNNNPKADVVVFITDCKHTYASYITGSDGCFSLSVDYDELDGNYHLLFSGNNNRGAVRELKGRGVEQYDYQNVIIDELPGVSSTPLRNYYIPAEFGPMTWREAKECCEKLVYAGHDDWELCCYNEWIRPSMYQECYWTDSRCDEGHECYGLKGGCFNDNELHYFIPQRLVHL